MAITDYQITPADIAAKGVVAAPDKLTGTTRENKMVFDRLISEKVAVSLNAVIAEMADAQTSEASRKQSESGRVSAEQSRVQGETTRAAAEQSRGTAEGGRASQETARSKAETERSTAETARAASEGTRQREETARAVAESDRKVKETARETSELGRESAEGGRVTAEQTRQREETARSTAETARSEGKTARSTAESGRAAKETERSTAETGRASAEIQRANGEGARQREETNRAAAEAARKVEETARVKTESARVSAEQGRASAEQDRAARDGQMALWENYDPNKRYVPLNKVAFGGSSFVCQVTCQGILPTDTAHWLKIAAKGADGQGSGDMLAAVYDPAGKGTDVFAYADTKANAAEAAAKAASIPLSQKGSVGGVAELDASGKVPSGQLPSYVDDVLEFASKAGFPAKGEGGKIYVDLATNLAWRWGGSVYVEISPSVALGETIATAYRGDRGKAAYDHSLSQANPHNVTAAQIGAATRSVYNATILASGWVGAAAPYTQNVAIPGILGSDTPVVGTVLSGTTEQKKSAKEAYNMISEALTSVGSVTFTCFEEKPTMDFAVQLEVTR